MSRAGPSISFFTNFGSANDSRTSCSSGGGVGCWVGAFDSLVSEIPVDGRIASSESRHRWRSSAVWDAGKPKDSGLVGIVIAGHRIAYRIGDEKDGQRDIMREVEVFLKVVFTVIDQAHSAS